jgi:hypothetical protein
MSEKEEVKKQESTEDAGAAAGSSESNSPAKAKPSVGLHHHVISTERCGTFNIYVQVLYIFFCSPTDKLK